MIVCSCNVLSDAEVRACLGGPGCPRTPAQIHRCLGCSPQCGRCAPTIRSLLADPPPESPARVAPEGYKTPWRRQGVLAAEAIEARSAGPPSA